ncbi:MAG: hypothetical protein ABFE13_27825 [Phycisphaerales bacterium]
MARWKARERLCVAVLAVTVIACGVTWVGWASETPESHGGSKLTALAEPNDLRWDLAEAFTFSWQTTELTAKITNSSAEVTSKSGTVERIISVSVDVGWNLKAKGLVIIDVNAPQVYELLDEDGNVIEYENAQSDQYRRYEDYPYYWTQNGTAYRNATEPEQFRVKVRLSADASQPAPSVISVLKGYIWAVYADAVIEVDVPFDPNLGDFESESAPELTFTVDVTTPPVPEPLEYICVVPSEIRGGGKYRPTRAVGLYRYATWVRSKTDRPVLGLNDGIRYPGSVYVFQDYAVIRTKLCDSTSGDVMRVNSQIVENWFATTRGAYCWGQLEQDRSAYDTICHIIVVHPVEVKIPFVLRDVPVPGVQSANK